MTTLDRTPGEAVAALDDQFSGKDRLVILTDEAEDPFFDEIKGAYRDHVFLDHHILDNYGPDFMQLPAHDSIALAYISQLVGAESPTHRHHDEHIYGAHPANARKSRKG